MAQSGYQRVSIATTLQYDAGHSNQHELRELDYTQLADEPEVAMRPNRSYYKSDTPMLGVI